MTEHADRVAGGEHADDAVRTRQPAAPDAPGSAGPAAPPGVGNAAFARFVDAEREDERADTMPSVPVGGGHNVTVRSIDGVLRVGVASEFQTVQTIVDVLLDEASPLTETQRDRVTEIQEAVDAAELLMNQRSGTYDELREKAYALRREVTVDVGSGFGPIRSKLDKKHAKYPDYQNALAASGDAKDKLERARTKAVNKAKDAIVELWDIGKDFLPTHLMPVGEVFRDKPDFKGDQANYTYHAGTDADPIPITWYKAPTDYPKLQGPTGREYGFGEAFVTPGRSFGLADANKPKLDWKLQKTAHNETREGQRTYNDALIFSGYKVHKNGQYVSPPLGNTHQFDGDHVKDLGFGGTDTANNYWPLDSTINRRAFTGYNAHYVVNYLDNGTPKSRAIGGLVGKWFIVKRFLGPNDAAIPTDGPAAGGTRR